MATYSDGTINKNGQGMDSNPKCSDEQGEVFGCEYDADPVFDVEPQNQSPWLKRFPSNSDFDAFVKYKLGTFTENCKPKEWTEYFGQNSISLEVDSDNVFPESEQLGIIINSNHQNEMERFNCDQEQPIDLYWQKPDSKKLVAHLNDEEVGSDKSQNMELDSHSPVNQQMANLSMEDEQESKNWEDESKEDLCFFNQMSEDNSDQLDSTKEIRWGKEDDKKLFTTFRVLWRKEMLNLRDVVSLPLKGNKVHK